MWFFISYHIVERCWSLLKACRWVAIRYEKTVRNYLSLVKLVCIRLFIRK
ncbi:transposase [Pectobacterium parmentieri]|uniref:Transposase n=1 Tax=Pectobacterium parmentieri TaxID=1905730 RepID=A0A8B3FMT9_PECPM|nr:hypothetical protein C5E25_06470 [Pectobacterium parmentieri]AYH12552.1 hypothetical protein C5E24_06150 [Pectobacterium parmentieri]AYH16826.1 hypothetical protein C5E23_06445 [Pectobacterium parmentieri]AYH21360.1 hypothetical protein C5E22_16370 [Pectobacterium parmentieri]AYH25527.1 hypothetical protein C5E21_06450 [Pectobacterium parmentieri]